MKNLRKTIIGSIQFAIEANNAFEQIFWISFTLLGTGFICYLLNIQVSSWNNFIKSKDSIPLSEIDFPALTFCSRGTTKYAIAERLGNLLPENKKLLQLRNEVVQHYVGYLERSKL